MKKQGKGSNSQTRSIRTLSRKDAPNNNESKRNIESHTYHNNSGFLPSGANHQDRSSSLLHRNAYGAVSH